MWLDLKVTTWLLAERRRISKRNNTTTTKTQWHTAVRGSTLTLLIRPTGLTCWFHLKDRVYVNKLISNISRHFVAMTTDKQIRTHGTMRQLKTSERWEVGLDRKSEQTALEPVDSAVWVSGWRFGHSSSILIHSRSHDKARFWCLGPPGLGGGQEKKAGQEVMSVTLTAGKMCELLHHKLSRSSVSMLMLTAVHAFLLSMMALQHETVCVCLLLCCCQGNS